MNFCLLDGLMENMSFVVFIEYLLQQAFPYLHNFCEEIGTFIVVLPPVPISL